ncbi:PAP15 [Scenedesmus sp. PABB004]|nr:PAP15 [Scenedesmus sp. PABB004]
MPSAAVAGPGALLVALAALALAGAVTISPDGPPKQRVYNQSGDPSGAVPFNYTQTLPNGVTLTTVKTAPGCSPEQARWPPGAARRRGRPVSVTFYGIDKNGYASVLVSWATCDAVVQTTATSANCTGPAKPGTVTGPLSTGGLTSQVYWVAAASSHGKTRLSQGNCTSYVTRYAPQYDAMVYASPLLHHVLLVGDPGQSANTTYSMQHLMAPWGLTAPRRAWNKGGMDLLMITGDLRWDMWGRLFQPLLSVVPMISINGNHEVGFEPDPLAAPIDIPLRQGLYNARYPQAVRGPRNAPDATTLGPATSATPWANAYYSVSVPGVATWIGLSSYSPAEIANSSTSNGFTKNSTQYKWLQRTLAVYEPLLLEASVDIVLLGHVHAYERSKPLADFQVDNGGCSPMHVTIGDAGNTAELDSSFITANATSKSFDCATPETYAFPSYQPQSCLTYQSGPGSGCANDARCYCYASQRVYNQSGEVSGAVPELPFNYTQTLPNGVTLTTVSVTFYGIDKNGYASVLVSWATCDAVVQTTATSANCTGPAKPGTVTGPLSTRGLTSQVYWVAAASSHGKTRLSQGNCTSYVTRYAPQYDAMVYASPLLHHVLLVGDPGQTANTTTVMQHLMAPWGLTAPRRAWNKGGMDLLMIQGDLSCADRSDLPGVTPAGCKMCNASDTHEFEYGPRWDTWGRLFQPLLSAVPMISINGNHEVAFEPDPLVPPIDIPLRQATYNARYPQAVRGPRNAPDATTLGPATSATPWANAYYSVSVPGVATWIALSSYSPAEIANSSTSNGFTKNSAQYKWLQRTLAVYEPLLLEGNVDIVIVGHVHAYERTKPLADFQADNTGCAPMHVTIGDGGNVEGMAESFITANGSTPNYNCSTPETYAFPSYQPQSCLTYQSGPGSGCANDARCFCYASQRVYNQSGEVSGAVPELPFNYTQTLPNGVTLTTVSVTFYGIDKNGYASVLVSWATCDAVVQTTATSANCTGPAKPGTVTGPLSTRGLTSQVYWVAAASSHGKTRLSQGNCTSYVTRYAPQYDAMVYASPLLHHVLLVGLKPGVRYNYTVVDSVLAASSSGSTPRPLAPGETGPHPFSGQFIVRSAAGAGLGRAHVPPRQVARSAARTPAQCSHLLPPPLCALTVRPQAPGAAPGESPFPFQIGVIGAGPGAGAAWVCSASGSALRRRSRCPTLPLRHAGAAGDPGQTANTTTVMQHLMAPWGLTAPRRAWNKGGMDLLMIQGDLSYADRSDLPGVTPAGCKMCNASDTHEFDYGPRWDTWGRLFQPLLSAVPTIVIPGNHEVAFEPDPLVAPIDIPLRQATYNARYPQAVRGPRNAPDATTLGPATSATPWANAYYSVSVPGVATWIGLSSYSPAEIANSSTSNGFTKNSAQFKWLQRTLAVYEPLLLEGNVDIVIVGHVHAYERTKPLANFQADNTGCAPMHVTIGDGGNVEGMAESFITANGSTPDYNCSTPETYAFPSYQPQSCLSFQSGPGSGCAGGTRCFCYASQRVYNQSGEVSGAVPELPFNYTQTLPNGVTLTTVKTAPGCSPEQARWPRSSAAPGAAGDAAAAAAAARRWLMRAPALVQVSVTFYGIDKNGYASVLVSWATCDAVVQTTATSANCTGPAKPGTVTGPLSTRGLTSQVYWVAAASSHGKTRLSQGNCTSYVTRYAPQYDAMVYASPLLHHVLLVGDPGQTANTTTVMQHLMAPWGLTAPRRAWNKGGMDLLMIQGDLSYADRSDLPGVTPAGCKMCNVSNTQEFDYSPRWDTWGRLFQPLLSAVPTIVIPGNHEVAFEPDPLVAPIDIPLRQAHYNARYPQAVRGPRNAPDATTLGPATSATPWANAYYSVSVPGVATWIALSSYSPAEIANSSTSNGFTKNSAQFKWLQRTLAVYEPLLLEGNVDIVLLGHVHAYERTKPLADFQVDRGGCAPMHVTIGDAGNVEGVASAFITANVTGPYLNCSTPETYSFPPFQPQQCFTYQSGPGSGCAADARCFCYASQPAWSAYREPSFGHGRLYLNSATSAVWQWFRNNGGVMTLTDEVTITRDPRCSASA